MVRNAGGLALEGGCDLSRRPLSIAEQPDDPATDLVLERGHDASELRCGQFRVIARHKAHHPRGGSPAAPPRTPWTAPRPPNDRSKTPPDPRQAPNTLPAPNAAP